MTGRGCREGHRLLFVALGLVVVGCGRGPRAPELIDSPVYQNTSEGFRFRVPEGWTQTASSNLPPGDFEGENFLVRYLVQSPEGGSTLQVLCFVDGNSTNLEEHNAEPSFGVQDWKITTPSAPSEVGDMPAERITYEGTLQGKTMHKEALCVRRGNRVYEFVGLYFDGDDKAQQSIERALASLVWDD